MYIGEVRLTKVDGKIRRGIIVELKYDDVLLEIDGNIISRKYWEIRKPIN